MRQDVLTSLDQFNSGNFLIVNGGKEISVGQLINIDNKIVKVLEVVKGNRNRVGLKIKVIRKFDLTEVA